MPIIRFALLRNASPGMHKATKLALSTASNVFALAIAPSWDALGAEFLPLFLQVLFVCRTPIALHVYCVDSVRQFSTARL